MAAHDEADLAILDELARGPRTFDELRAACDFDVSGILDGWEELAAGPGGVARVERLLARLDADREGPERFRSRLDRLVARGLVIAAAGSVHHLTERGAAFRRSCS